VSPRQPIPGELRAHAYYTSEAAAHQITACAIVTSSVLGRVIGNLMIGMSKTNLPLKLFDTAEAAEQWLLETWQPKQRPRVPQRPPLRSD